jgi:hypothetical protein
MAFTDLHEGVLEEFASRAATSDQTFVSLSATSAGFSIQGQRQVSKGFCAQCGAPAEKYRCHLCLAQHVIYIRKCRASASAAGLCYLCSAPLAGHKNLCLECRKAANAQQTAANKKRFEERDATGQCRACTAQRVPGATYCPACLQVFRGRNKARQARSRAAGLCVRCPNPAAEGCTRCRQCLDKAKDRAARRKDLQAQKEKGRV